MGEQRAATLTLWAVVDKDGVIVYDDGDFESRSAYEVTVEREHVEALADRLNSTDLSYAPWIESARPYRVVQFVLAPGQ